MGIQRARIIGLQLGETTGFRRARRLSIQEGEDRS